MYTNAIWYYNTAKAIGLLLNRHHLKVTYITDMLFIIISLLPLSYDNHMMEIHP